MGPALETFLTVFLIILVALALLGALTRPFWKRCTRFFVRWYESDMRAEQERRREQQQRKQAEQELRQFCHDEDVASETSAESRVGHDASALVDAGQGQ